MCNLCDRASNREDINVQESMDVRNSVCPYRVGKFCYLGAMLNGGRGANSASAASLLYMGKV